MPTTVLVPPVVPPTPPIGRRGHMTFRLRQLPEPLILEQVVLDPTWNWFKTVMVFVGGISVFLIFGTLMFWLGEWRYERGASVPAPVAIVQPVASMPTQPATTYAPAPPPPVQLQQNTAPQQQPQWNSLADCQRHYVLTLGQDPEGACDSLK